MPYAIAFIPVEKCPNFPPADFRSFDFVQYSKRCGESRFDSNTIRIPKDVYSNVHCPNGRNVSCIRTVEFSINNYICCCTYYFYDS